MLDITLPIAPMEALLVSKLPSGDQWAYEPKWDGFRCIAIRDGDTIELFSKADQPLTRYFPEVAKHLLALPATQFVLDGELVTPVDGALSFDDLLQRIHPAASRVAKLSIERPAVMIVFDLLADETGANLLNMTQGERRIRLESFAKENFAGDDIRLSPMTRSIETAREWLGGVGGSVDGVMAKRVDLEYRQGERTGMQKVKLIRTADCVIGGFRYADKEPVIGSLLLGLYNNEGLLDHIGFCSGLKHPERVALVDRLAPLIEAPGFTGKKPGGPSRWSTRRTDEWQPLRTELVIEVSYDHFTGGRFRHGTGLLRWRDDKSPSQCTMDQIATPSESAAHMLNL